jgi:hypothetical protein
MAHAKTRLFGEHRNLTANEPSGNTGCVSETSRFIAVFQATEAKFVLKLSEINMEINDLRRN